MNLALLILFPLFPKMRPVQIFPVHTFLNCAACLYLFLFTQCCLYCILWPITHVGFYYDIWLYAYIACNTIEFYKKMITSTIRHWNQLNSPSVDDFKNRLELNNPRALDVDVDGWKDNILHYHLRFEASKLNSHLHLQHLTDNP